MNLQGETDNLRLSAAFINRKRNWNIENAVIMDGLYSIEPEKQEIVRGRIDEEY